MTAAAGLKRLGLAIVAVIAAGAGALALVSHLMSSETIRQQVLAEIHAVTGLDPALRGEAVVSLFPSGSVSFADVTLGDKGQPALAAERLVAHLRFFPLLTGHVEIADVSLERPTISVNVAADGRSNWSGLVEHLARGQNPDAPRPSAFSEMRINNGAVVVHDQQRNLVEIFRDVEFSLAWPSISKSFGATGHFIWHDQPLDASLTLGDFPAAIEGKRTGVKIRVAGSAMKAAFDGSISFDPTLKIEGTVAADTSSLRDVLIWTGQEPLPGGGFGRFALKAKTNVVAGTIELTAVNVELDGNVAEGVLTFATDGRKTLQGTLAADTLDLTPYISTVRLLTANQREWNNGRIALDGLSGVDLDLRLSAAKVTLSNAKIGRTAIAANLRGGNLVITVGEAQAYGGVIRGSIALANFDTGVDVKSQLQFTDVDLESCLGQLFSLRRLEGKGNISFAVEGSGDSVLAVTRSLNGTATLVGTDGAMLGINVEQLLRRLERRPLSGGGNFRSGRTPFDKLTVALKIVQGTVSVDDVKTEGSAVRLALGGTASIPERNLDLKGTATLVSTSNPDAATFELPFIVQGPWEDPLMLPDPESLLRRSGAAAPLLNAERERRARDAVRSAIERFTGKPPASAAAPADPAATPAAAPSPAQQGAQKAQ